MTIYTKQNLANEEKKPEDELKFDLAVEVPVDTQRVRVERLRATGRRRLCIQFIVLLCLIAGLTVCVVGSIYLYKNSSAKRYKGWCGVRYQPTYNNLMMSSTANPIAYLDERVDIDNDVETLTVPKYDDNDEATFTHDFARNITLIKDITDEVCYVLPLDTKRIPHPRTFADILRGVYYGDYIPDATEISEDYRVVRPDLDDEYIETNYGLNIATQCQYYNTYKLVKVEGDDVPPTTTTAAPVVRKFIMFPGGEFVMQYIIKV